MSATGSLRCMELVWSTSALNLPTQHGLCQQQKPLHKKFRNKTSPWPEHQLLKHMIVSSTHQLSVSWAQESTKLKDFSSTGPAPQNTRRDRVLTTTATSSFSSGVFFWHMAVKPKGPQYNVGSLGGDSPTSRLYNIISAKRGVGPPVRHF